MNPNRTLLRRIHGWDLDQFQKVSQITLNQRFWLLAARQVSRTADGWGYLVVPCALLIAGVEEAAQFFRLLVTALLIERLIYFAAKNGFKRKRPANIVPGYHSHIIPSDEFSFPSGHTSAAFLFVTLTVLIWGPLMLFMYLWSSGVAASRVILGVHFPTDTLMGACLGTGTAILICQAGGL
ncbi:MAG: phosphatase PAP2 family protein [Pseudomonadales bacterium]|nr:phosphatase PAP2 family protein [Pseudomonadales bacterium]